MIVWNDTVHWAADETSWPLNTGLWALEHGLTCKSDVWIVSPPVLMEFKFTNQVNPDPVITWRCIRENHSPLVATLLICDEYFYSAWKAKPVEIFFRSPIKQHDRCRKQQKISGPIPEKSNYQGLVSNDWMTPGGLSPRRHLVVLLSAWNY